MSRVKTFPIEGFELDDLFNALEMSRMEVSTLCGVTYMTPGWWRHAGKIPVTHLLKLRIALQDKLKNKTVLTELDKRAVELMVRVNTPIFPITDNGKGKETKSTEVLAELLECCELNMDDMEPETLEVIKKAQKVLGTYDKANW